MLTQRISSTLLLFLACMAISAKTAASLQNASDVHSQKDTIKVNLLNKSAKKIISTDTAKALKLLIASEKLATAVNYNQGKMECFLHLGKIYSARKQYEKTIQYATQGTIIANKLDDKKYQRSFFLLLAESHYDKSKSVNDSIVSEEVRDIAAEIKYKYFLKDSLDQTAHRERSLVKTVIIKNDQLLLARLQNYLWIAGIVVLVLVLAFILALMRSRKVKMLNKQLMTEQKLRRSQMNPHFIFNSLQSILGLIINDKQAEAKNYIHKFSALTRQILESSDDDYTSLSEEIELIKNYVTLQQILYSHKFEFAINVDEAIDINGTLLPPMLSQPFIENAIKHGLSKVKNGLLHIRFFMKNDKLFFEVKDNGAGFGASTKLDNHKSMAIDITRQRLAHYTNNQHFAVHTDNVVDRYKNIVGARVVFEVPYLLENRTYASL